MSSLQRFRHQFGRLLRLCGVIAGVITFLVMWLVVANALLRYGLNAPIQGAFEITEAALPLIVFLALALTQHRGEHIRVTLVTRRLPPGPARALDTAAMALGAAFFGWCAWAAWGFALKSLAMNEQEWGSVRFPIYPVKFAICFGLLLLCAQFALDALITALGGQDADGEKSGEAGA